MAGLQVGTMLALACLAFGARVEAQYDLDKLGAKLEIKDRPKADWPKLIGQKLRSRPDLLPAADRGLAAQALMKEAAVVQAIEQLKSSPDQAADEATWFYLEVMRGSDRNLADAAGCGIQAVAARMDAVARRDLVNAAIGFLAMKDGRARTAGVEALSRIAEGLTAKALDDLLTTLLARARDKKEPPEVRLGTCAAAGNHVARVGDDLRQRIIKAALDLTDITQIEVRYQVSVLLTDVGKRLTSKALEEMLQALRSLFEDKRQSKFARGFFAYDMAIIFAHIDTEQELLERMMAPVVAHANDPDIDPYHVYDGWTVCGQKFKGKLAQDAARAALGAMKGQQPTALNIAAAALIRLAPQMDGNLVDAADQVVDAMLKKEHPDYLKKMLGRLAEALKKRKEDLKK